MKNLFEKFQLLSIEKKALITFIVFMIALWTLPNIIVYAVGIYISYKFVTRKSWKYILITIFSICTLASVGELLPEETVAPVIINEYKSDQVIPETEDIILPSTNTSVNYESEESVTKPVIETSASVKTYNVIRVVDGDTIDVSIDGKTERLRLIGINTPETVDPRKPVECFGVEASNKAKSLLTNKKVALESDPSQGERDKYDRLLRYVFLEDGTNFNLLMIKEGYAYEYTYDVPYKYQTEFKQAQKEAEGAKAGLWGDMCNGSSVLIPVTSTTQTNPNSAECTIKGNISSTKEKIYHVIGCGSYSRTIIDESQGERWFCTEQEALDAGWRKALNCN